MDCKVWDSGEPKTLNEFIRTSRQRVAPGTRALGSFIRHSSRRAKRVSQEEAAEAIGVTRQWYVMMETRASIRISPNVLSRFSDVFMLSAIERERLLRLALPGLVRRDAHPAPQPLEDRFAWMRTSAQLLWNAETPATILAIAAEQAAKRISDSPLVFSTQRLETGNWERVFYGTDRALAQRNEEFWTFLTASLSPERADAVNLYPTIAGHGEVGTIASYSEPWLKARMRYAILSHDLEDWHLMHARVRSKSGTIAGLVVQRPDIPFSDDDRSIVSTIADLASLALA